jgi:hypothetical protein
MESAYLDEAAIGGASVGLLASTVFLITDQNGCL